MRSRAAFFTCLNAITVGSLLWLIAAHGACPFPLDLWFQFGLGMMVYQIISSPGDRASKVFFAIAVILAATYAIQYIGPHNLNRPSSRAETLFATVFALAVLALYRVDAAMMRLRVVRAFAWLGSISYSLYLTHMIMRPLFGRVAERMHWTGSRYGISFLVQIAADIAFAYLFHLLIERPFMSSSGKARQSEIHLAAPPSVPHSQVEEPRVAV
jgi:peptidoglycan/LPS O-acetylase OafA/YrhL